MPLVEDVLLQIEPAAQRSVPLAPEQQASPGLPQAVQIELRQASPEPQLVPQQGWPEAPQLAQRPPPHWPPPLPPVPVLLPVPQVEPSAMQVSL